MFILRTFLSTYVKTLHNSSNFQSKKRYNRKGHEHRPPKSFSEIQDHYGTVLRRWRRWWRRLPEHWVYLTVYFVFVTTFLLRVPLQFNAVRRKGHAHARHFPSEIEKTNAKLNLCVCAFGKFVSLTVVFIVRIKFFAITINKGATELWRVPIGRKYPRPCFFYQMCFDSLIIGNIELSRLAQRSSSSTSTQ